MSRPSYTEFRRRLIAREHVLGTFVKTPTTHSTEILGLLGFDFVIMDQEHSPWDRAAIDVVSLAARASNVAGLVRVGDPSDANILSVLDSGAAGVMVPHVDSPEKAKQIVAACRYRGGARGFANTTRAGRFGGLTTKEHVEAADSQIAVVAMIEDIRAVDNIDEIVKVKGVDCFFIGRGDLTAAIGANSQTSPETRKLVDRVMAAAKRADARVMMLAASRADAIEMKALGASAFIFSNDQNLMKSAAAAALKEYAAPLA
jgi:2-keto-3-deoxy-L-rhamnonate aldolase RhmA